MRESHARCRPARCRNPASTGLLLADRPLTSSGDIVGFIDGFEVAHDPVPAILFGRMKMPCPNGTSGCRLRCTRL